MPAPVFTQIDFSNNDKPYQGGEGYVEKLQQLSDNFTALVAYDVEIGQTVVSVSAAMIAAVAADRLLAQTARTQSQALAAAAAAIVDIDSVVDFTNQKAFSQAVHFTEAGSGSTGARVLSVPDVQPGEGDFTIFWDGVLVDYTNRHLISKVGTDYYELLVVPGGTMRLALGGDTAENVQSTAVIADYDVKLAAVLSRGSANDTVTFYCNGVQVGDPVSTTAKGDISPTGVLTVSGRNESGFREPTITRSAYFFNRALSGAEVLNLCVNGVSFADKGASNISQSTTGFVNYDAPNNYPTFSGASATGFHAESDDSNTDTAISSTPATYTLEAGKNYKIVFDASLTGVAPTYAPCANNAGTTLPGIAFQTVVDGRNVFYFTPSETDLTVSVVFASGVGVVTAYTISNLEFLRVGATLQLEPEGIQPSPGQWLDSSGNKNHAKLPATGATLMRPKREFEIRWTNSWAGTPEAQYVGGVNEAILTSKHFITSIVGTVSGASGQNIVLGDGSDDDRYVVSVALVDGVQVFTVVIGANDGTNLKMVIDPDANFTGSITSTIKGYILE